MADASIGAGPSSDNVGRTPSTSAGKLLAREEISAKVPESPKKMSSRRVDRRTRGGM
jgi:hypothetical protein